MLLHQYPKSVQLKEGREAVLRPLAEDDYEKLYSFFRDLPEEDRLFLAHDVSDPEVVRRWTTDIDLERVIPLVAIDEDRIVGDGTLHMASQGWMKHVGQIRLVTACSHRGLGLGVHIARELVALAAERGIQKLQAHVIADSVGAVRMFRAAGFNKVAVIEKLVKDQNGTDRDLAIMLNEVVSLTQIMESWIHEMTIPGHRASSEGMY